MERLSYFSGCPRCGSTEQTDRRLRDPISYFFGVQMMTYRVDAVEESIGRPTIGRIAVVIPCYRVRAHILTVLKRIGTEVTQIYVVDDCCPESTGHFVEQNALDPRVTVLYNRTNLGVGGATLVGLQQAALDGAEVAVKIDGDGQMDPSFIPSFVGIILAGEADYAKGNRFFDLDGLKSMPTSRLIGNAGLSFLAKFSTGYWHTFDPTNGFFAIHISLLPLIPLDKISRRYFFESDLLFRL